MTTVKDLIAQGKATLESTSPTAQLDSEILLAHVLDKLPTWLKTWPDHSLSEKELGVYLSLLNKRAEGQPVAYLLGEQPFWSVSLKVTSDTLIPRPETELLIETILALKGSDDCLSVLDMGTGTGAIALALAAEKNGWIISACDQSKAALAVAKENSMQLDLPVSFKCSNWFSEYDVADSKFDIIVSNPPYIEDNDPHLSQGDVRFEPLSALVSGHDGLKDIRAIVASARDHLNDQGMILFEHGFNQGHSVRKILSDAGFQNVETRSDLSGHERVTLGYKS